MRCMYALLFFLFHCRCFFFFLINKIFILAKYVCNVCSMFGCTSSISSIYIYKMLMYLGNHVYYYDMCVFFCDQTVCWELIHAYCCYAIAAIRNKMFLQPSVSFGFLYNVRIDRSKLSPRHLLSASNLYKYIKIWNLSCWFFPLISYFVPCSALVHFCCGCYYFVSVLQFEFFFSPLKKCTLFSFVDGFQTIIWWYAQFCKYCLTMNSLADSLKIT